MQISLQRRHTLGDVDSGSKIINNTWRLFEADVSRVENVIFTIKELSIIANLGTLAALHQWSISEEISM